MVVDLFVLLLLLGVLFSCSGLVCVCVWLFVVVFFVVWFLCVFKWGMLGSYYWLI